MNRAERRKLQKSGNLPWEQKPSPKESGVGTGWFGEMDKAYSNGKYAVMVRTLNTMIGRVEHACIRNTGNTDILFGKERVAVEVFPAESELVDEAGMYHIWVFAEGDKLPFGL